MVRNGLELEAQVFDQPDEFPALPLYSQQRVDAHRVGRDEFVKLDGWRSRFLGAGLEEMWDLRRGEAPGEMDDQAIVFTSKFNPANHAGADANPDPGANAADTGDDAPKSRRAVTALSIGNDRHHAESRG
jgi:hypothetical protein